MKQLIIVTLISLVLPLNISLANSLCGSADGGAKVGECAGSSGLWHTRISNTCVSKQYILIARPSKKLGCRLVSGYGHDNVISCGAPIKVVSSYYTREKCDTAKSYVKRQLRW